MKLKKGLLIIAAMCAVMAPTQLKAWSITGHNVIAYIAEQYLTDEAKQSCYHYLNHSLPHYSSWMDRWRYHPDYVHTSRWHAIGVVDEKFNLGPADKYGDGADYRHEPIEGDYLLAQLDRIISELKNHHNIPRERVELNLKLLIHMVGDMHCPVHTFYADKAQILGRLQSDLKHKGKPRRVHMLWDCLPETLYKDWYCEDFHKHLCTHSEKERKQLCQGTPLEWIKQMTPDYRGIYDLVDPDVDFRDTPQANKEKMQRLCNRQLALGGYRMAHILNTIFKNNAK